MSRPVYLRAIGDRRLFAQRRFECGTRIAAFIFGMSVIVSCLLTEV